MSNPFDQPEPDDEPTQPKAKDVFSRYKKDVAGAKKLAESICSEIQESEREKGPLVDRWIRLREIHDCDERTSQVQLIEGMQPSMLPLSRPKADRIVGAVVDGITGANPYVQVFDQQQPNVNLDEVEQDLMTLVQDAGDQQAIRTGTEDALITNAGVWRIRPLIDERRGDANAKVTGLEWEAIDPIDFACYPPYFGTYADAKTIGHRRSELLYRVKRDMKEGRYYDVDLHGGDDPLRGRRKEDDKINTTYDPQKVSDDFVELWEVITELDLDETGEYKLYLCVVALTEAELLSIQEYPYSRPWYVEVRTERTRKRVFPSTSAMQRLQRLQLDYSDLFTAYVQGVFASIGPITILTGGGLMAKVTKAKPFMIIEAPADVKVQSIAVKPQIEGIPIVLQKIEEVADSLTGISRTGEGQAIPSATATEISGLLAAQQQAKDQYTQVIAESVEDVMELALEFYKAHTDDLQKAYKGRLIAPAETIRGLEAELSVNGRNGSNNPQIVLQKLQMLLQIVQQMPPGKYDPSKIVDQMVQMLDFPFSVERLEADQDPAVAMLTQLIQAHPEFAQLLENGESLPNILQELQQRAQSANQPVPNAGSLPQPGMGPSEGPPPGLLGGGTSPMFNPGNAPGNLPPPGPMPGV